MKTVIMAGGRGTRIAEVNSEVPKPMIPIFGKPILEYEIECLEKQGVIEGLICPKTTEFYCPRLAGICRKEIWLFFWK